MKYLIVVLLTSSGFVFADSHLIETRYCGDDCKDRWEREGIYGGIK